MNQFKVVSTEIYDKTPDYMVTLSWLDNNEPSVHITKIKNFNKTVFTQLQEVMAVLLLDLKEAGYKIVHTIVPDADHIKFATRFGFMPKQLLINEDTGGNSILMSQEVG